MSERSDRRGRGGPPRECLSGIHPVREALRARRRTLFELRVREGARRPEVEALVEAAKAAEVPVRSVPAAELAVVVGTERSGAGVELEVGPLREVDFESLLEASDGPRILVALDGVEDPQNLGAIARVAEAAGVSGLILTRRHAPPLSPAVARASAGAIEWLPVARVTNLSRSLKSLKENNFWTFGSDPDAAQAIFDLPDRLLAGDVVLVLGAEGRGLRHGIEQLLDYRVKIPMTGHVDSLNVATAAAVMLFEFRRRSRVATLT